jgi:tetratricopeptide (TPR) repeat protein
LLVVALAIAGVWWVATPAVPEVRLPEGADPALVEAVARGREAIRSRPRSDQPWGRLAMLLQAHSLDTEAAVFYARAEGCNPAEPRWPYLHAVVLEGTDGERAIELLRRAVELGGPRPEARQACLLRLGERCLEYGRLDEAREAYAAVLRQRPGHARAHLGLARLAVRGGEAAAALPHLQACADSPEVRKEARLVLAEVHQRRGDARAAAAAAAEAEKLPPDPPAVDPLLDEANAVLVGRAGAIQRLAELQEQGRLPEAQARERTTLENYPDIRYLEVGRTLLRQRRWAEAEGALRQSLRLNPAELDVYYLLGKALFEQRRFAEAAESFRHATEVDAKYGPAYREWGRCSAAMGHGSEAIRHLREAIKYVPHDADAHRELGVLLAGAGDRNGALHHLGQAVQLNPKDQRAQEMFEQARKGHP